MPCFLLFVFRFSFLIFFSLHPGMFIFFVSLRLCSNHLLLSASMYFVVRVLSACVICTLPHLAILLFFCSSSILFFFSSFILAEQRCLLGVQRQRTNGSFCGVVAPSIRKKNILQEQVVPAGQRAKCVQYVRSPCQKSIPVRNGFSFPNIHTSDLNLSL